MPNYGFSLLAAPLACLLALHLKFIEATYLLTFVVMLHSRQWGAPTGLPATILSFGSSDAYFQSPGQGLALVLAGTGLIALLTVMALTTAFLSRSSSRGKGVLREPERDYRNLFEQAHDAIIVFLPEREIVIDVNERACVLYGYSRDEFVGMSLEAISKDVDSGKDMIKKTLEVGDYLNFETVQYRKDGTEMFLEINASAISYRGQTAVLSINRDVTERIRAEQALRRAEEKYRGIFEHAVEGIFQSTPDGRFISVNPAMARMFGFDSPEQMVAERTDIEWQHYVDPQRRAEKRRILEEHGVVLGFVAEAYRRDGSTLWTSSNTRAVRDAEGAVCYYEGFLEDVTDRVRAAEWELRQQRLTDLRADVIAALAQRDTPLRVILRQSAEAMVKHLDAAFARVWTLNQAENVLELQASAGMYTHIDDPYARIPVGCLKVGFIAEKRTPHLTNDVQGDERIGDREWARREGLVSFAGYPLLVEDRLVGVMAMFARRPLQQDTLDALSFIADTIAQGVERLRAEEALRDSEERFRRLIEEVHVGIILTGPGAEIFLSNRAAHRMLGLTRDQLIRKTPFDSDWNIVHDDGAPFSCEALPVPRAIATRSPVRNVVMGVYRPMTQDRVWLLVDAEPHLADDGGVSHVVCTFSNITERKRAEEALRQSEERNRAILKAIPDLIFLQTKEGVYLDYHAKNEGELLVAPENFIGKNMRDVLPPELSEEFASCFERAVRTGVTQMCEYTLPVAAQQRRYEARIVSCDGDKILTVVRDITAYRLAEAQRTQLLGRLVNAQEEERARLAREVHDEFAAYLSALKWGIESLKRGKGLPARAESELSYLLRLTAQLQHKVRDFAFELSPAELNNEDGLPAALDRYIRRWVERADGRIEAEFRCVGFHAARCLPREVEIALYRVTQEALTNVLKHAEARHVTLTLGFYLEEPGRGIVSLIVEDDGAGFAPRNSEGAERGFGLKGIGERMALLGGTLEVRSGREGTTLIVSVPVSIPHEEGGDEKVANTDRR